MAAIDSFWNDYHDQANVSFDGIRANAGQCVQPVGFYVRDYLHLPVYFADAVYWYTNFENSPLRDNFTRIPNLPDNAPQHGDIVIWSGSLPNSGGAGHIATCWNPFAGGFVSVDSNWAGKTVHMVSHNYSYVLGWLRPNNQVIQGDDGMKIGGEDNWYWRFNRLHHQLVRNGDLSREVFNSIVGADAWSVVESWSDHPEADQLIADQVEGQQARQDNWPGQIYGLQDQLKASQKVADQMNATIAAVQADDKATKAQLKAALDKLAPLTSELQTANDKLVDIQKQQTTDEETGKSFFRALARIIPDFLKSNKKSNK